MASSAISSAHRVVGAAVHRKGEASVQNSPVRVQLSGSWTAPWRPGSFRFDGSIWRGHRRRHGHSSKAVLGEGRLEGRGTHGQGRASESGASLAFEGSSISSQVSRIAAAATQAADGSRDSKTGHSFYEEELREAALAVRELEQAAQSSTSLLPGRTAEEEEQTPEVAVAREDEGSEPPDFDFWQGRDRFGQGRLPIETNGPPDAILRAYLERPEGSQQQARGRLRPLPLPMPHKLRPPGLPRASIRRRNQTPVSSKRSGDSCNRDLAADIRALPASAPVSRVLKKWVGVLKRGALARTVRELGRAELKERALQVVLWAQRYAHLWPDYTSLCALIEVMVEAGEADTAFELQRTLGRGSEKPARALARALARAGRLADAAGVLEEMRRAGWAVDSAAQAEIMKWACRAGDRAAVEVLLGELGPRGVKLGGRDCAAVMAACGDAGFVDVTEDVFALFERGGNSPDVFVFTALLAALAKAGRYSEAAAQIARVGEWGCAPDLVAYRVMVDVCAELGDVELAMKLFGELGDAGFEPCPEILDALVELHVRVGRMGTAAGLLRTMHGMGFVPSARTLACVSATAHEVDGRSRC